jgi:sulfonate transport system permease protein
MRTRSGALSGRAVLEGIATRTGIPLHVLSALWDAAEEGDANDAQIVYRATDFAEHVYIVQSGLVRLERAGEGRRRPRWAGPGDFFGGHRLTQVQGESAAAVGPSSLVRISIHALDRALAATGPQSSAAFATAIRGALDAPSFDRTRKPRRRVSPTAVATRLLGRTLGWLRAPATYRRLLGYALFFGAWYLAVDVLALPRFDKLPGISQVVGEWLSTNPTYGLSLHTPVYFAHIWSSLSRIALAFLLATVLGVPTGLALGASATFREYVFPVFELLRPIPIPAWVPLAIVAFSGAETPIVFVSFLGSFFATALNTLVGVRSIEPKYLLAAQCLGARPGQLFRHVILPASVPFIVTGLQISIGLAWFSLAAAEMISGQFGLGYLINTSYTMVQYPTIVIGMLTLGILGFATSACVRLAGERFMAWRARELSLEIP